MPRAELTALVVLTLFALAPSSAHGQGSDSADTRPRPSIYIVAAAVGGWKLVGVSAALAFIHRRDGVNLATAGGATVARVYRDPSSRTGSGVLLGSEFHAGFSHQKSREEWIVLYAVMGTEIVLYDGVSDESSFVFAPGVGAILPVTNSIAGFVRAQFATRWPKPDIRVEPGLLSQIRLSVGVAL